MADQRNVTLAVTGAGGTRMARFVLESLVKDDRIGQVDLMVSAAGRKLIAHETGRDEAGDAVELVLGGPAKKVVTWDPEDLAGGPTSGSYPSWGMLVVPCALGVVGRIAHGIANTLIERAADVTLKERRPLVLCVRDTPFSLIHLRNMTQVTEAGGTVYPMIPTFYNVPQSVDQFYEEFTARLLGFIGLPQSEYYAYSGRETPAHRDRVGR
ncbi:UbiX family flavin prenyltransferase [Actinacidiphila oryziradicis]|jgi:4-hydroxy-3-polyprenylbenzoate decarboxylase|uniref:UbiX family flavin prenyltransferase n=1 Tax=Actinacidiphila oryziradicis TaxID=2571141 RepID=A0A4U0SI68_9ACTN|nr:UbiX family flavin prenyltransferase [Actinacidiphila oryziradicis]MCW2872991.1 3-octaprenyl-4-hydroxybenzoate carboxy-lyase [Actinacidiphila oryziradicis]TJZ99954.1 UbiX family flavin prenyltransferase [Actinacidiphila oryziradicis]